MSLKPFLSFSSGELDPILHDNVTLEKFNKGLATARNVVVGKTGSILSRFSRALYKTTKNVTDPVKLYYSKGNNVLLEWGDEYVRAYFLDITDPTPLELSHAMTEDDLPNMHFATSGNYIYVFAVGKAPLKLSVDSVNFIIQFIDENEIFEVSNAPQNPTLTPVGAPTGYGVDYVVTAIVNGEETLPLEISIPGVKKPITSTQSNKIFVEWVDATPLFGFLKNPSQLRVYSRPKAGSAYGFLGTGEFVYNGGTFTWEATFADLGGEPDYSNNIPDIITNYGLNSSGIKELYPYTGAIYQQRLILNPSALRESIVTSRPGYQNNFYRDFPYSADSALLFKSGSDGNSKILRIIESDGLIVFTSSGVFASFGLLSINNLALEKKGSWVIKSSIPPLLVPGGLFFVDKDNIIRQLVFSQEISAYESIEQTIFSNHLFENRLIETWAFQNGSVPLIIVTFSDGTFATFTYNFEHQMRAWTRHDSRYILEQVEGSDRSDTSFFLINKNGERYIEVSLPRRTPVSTIVNNPEADKLNLIAFMDGIKTYSFKVQTLVVFENYFDIQVTAVVPNVWDGNLSLTSNPIDAFQTYVVGDVIRFFHPVEKYSIDLEIITKVSDTIVTVTPSEEFPSEYSNNPNLYATSNVIYTMEHLEGESVSVIVDGAVVASPNNDVENYPILTVTGGQITLPENMRGAIVLVGRPIVADIKTLNVTTVEQSPTQIESLNISKLYVKVFKSRGLYCSNRFPEEANSEVDGSSVQGMEDMFETDVPENDILIGNKYLSPITKRLERTIPGHWRSQGQMSFRQVDPYHFEILSIIPDVEILRRSDR